MESVLLEKYVPCGGKTVVFLVCNAQVGKSYNRYSFFWVINGMLSFPYAICERDFPVVAQTRRKQIILCPRENTRDG